MEERYDDTWIAEEEERLWAEEVESRTGDHQTKTKYPGITKITTAAGEVKYRLIIAVGKRPDGKWIQACYIFANLTLALKKRTEIKASRDRGTLVKRDSVTFDELCQRCLDSRHDVREVTKIGYSSWLSAACSAWPNQGSGFEPHRC